MLVEPTIALLAAHERIPVPLTLFCDVACLWRYREDGDPTFPDAAEAQLRDAVRRGHDVQALVHPQWLHATREDGRWRAPAQTFLVGALDDPAPLLARAKAYLEELLQPVDQAYSCVAFRAGNYGLQPHHERVLAALLQTGYEIDSSVVPGLVARGGAAKIDYRGWRWPEKSGMFFGVHEVPIATARFGPPEAFFRWLNRPAKPQPRGQSAPGAPEPRRSLLSRLFSLDPLELGPIASRLERTTRRYLRRVDRDVEFAFSSHPRAVDAPELEALAAYHDWLDRNYEVEALTFRELAARRPEEPEPSG